jgi:alpha-ketoglutarate-dependent taurine dioxygenase
VSFGARVNVQPAPDGVLRGGQLDGSSLLLHLAKDSPAVLQSLLHTHGVSGLCLFDEINALRTACFIQTRTPNSTHGVLGFLQLLVFSQRDPLEPRLMAAVMSQLGSLSQCNASRSAKVVEGVANAPSMAVPGLPFVRRLGNIIDTETGMPMALHCRTGYEWHSDGERRLTMLSCTEAPRAGGETLFTSSSEVYTNLPADERAQADCIIAVYGSANTSGGPSAFDCERGLRMNADGTRLLRPVASKPSGCKEWESRRPLVRSRDGDPSQRFITVDIRHFLRFEYFVSESSDSSDDGECQEEEEARKCAATSARPSSSTRLVSLSPEESQELLSRWLRLTLQPQEPLAALDPQTLLPGHGEVTTFASTAVYSHKWVSGDVVLWDNDWVLHTPTPAASVEGRRLMHQIIMKKAAGDGEISAAQDGRSARPVEAARTEHVSSR